MTYVTYVQVLCTKTFFRAILEEQPSAKIHHMLVLSFPTLTCSTSAQNKKKDNKSEKNNILMHLSAEKQETEFCLFPIKNLSKIH